MKPRLAAEGLVSVYERLERPLVPVLARMEQRGISIDRQMLSRLSGELAQGAGRLEDEIYELAGERFNIGSPKQLGDILFGKMGLPGGSEDQDRPVVDLGAGAGRARRGRPRTAAQDRRLAPADQAEVAPIPTRCRATSIPRPGASTPPTRWPRPRPGGCPPPSRTCRTSRCAPRRAARSAPPSSPTPGNKLISADYSQIELRVLAHVADIPQLTQAFADGLDIHAMTASEMFGVPVEGMPSEVRRRAKAINFGIIYGISAFGLANQLSIPREEAGDYIKKLFRALPRHPRLHGGDQGLARENGYVETIFGRRMHYPGDPLLQSLDPRLQRARLDQRADPGHGRRHHPPRHGAHGAGAGEGRAVGARCCCRCMTN